MSSRFTLVTGATGFVGHQLVARLIEQGEHVKALVRPGSNLKYLRGLPEERFRLAVGDITLGDTVYQALAGCDRMYHVAANFRMWDRNPDNILRPAIEGTRGVLDAAKQRGLKKIVVTSSVAALGNVATPDEVMTEDHDFNLSDPEIYIRAKREADELAMSYAHEGLPVVIVQPSGIFGPEDWKPTPSGESLLEFLSWNRLIPFPCTEGGLNIVDVADVVSGHILAMDRGRVGERYILGGENVTFAEMFGLMARVSGVGRVGKPSSPALAQLGAGLMELAATLTGGEPKITRKMTRDYAFAYAYVSSQKAEEELGYSHRPARVTLTRALKWFLAHGYVPEQVAGRVRVELGQ